MSLYVLALIAICGLFGDVRVHGDCTASGVQSCTNSMNFQNIASATTQTQINAICSTVTTMINCVQQLGCADTDAAAAAWSGIRDYLQYLCTGGGMQVYMANMQCFGSTAFTTALLGCVNTYSSAFSAAGTNLQMLCTTTNAFVKCYIASANTGVCSVEAQNFWSTSATKLFKYELQLICGTGKSTQSSLLVMAIAFLYMLYATTF